MKNNLLIFALCFLVMSCNQNKKENLTVQDIEIFKNTPAWELAEAVDIENLSEIQSILANQSIVNYQEPVFGTTVLMRAINTEKYQATKQLLESGANPNIISKIGSFALFERSIFERDASSRRQRSHRHVD